MSNTRLTVFYTGVTSDLYARVTEHKQMVFPNSFTSRYHALQLIYYEAFYSIEEAISREKQVKKYSRVKKLELITKLNPGFKDLYEDIKKW